MACTFRGIKVIKEITIKSTILNELKLKYNFDRERNWGKKSNLQVKKKYLHFGDLVLVNLVTLYVFF